MLRRRSASREAQPPKPDSRPLLSPLFTHFSSPETRYTQSPGSMDHDSRPRIKHRDQHDGMPMDQESAEESGDDDRNTHDLGRLARGIDGVGKLFDTRKNSDFLAHANTSLHSLLSRHGTLLEHPDADSGPPTGSSGYPTGHILAPASASSSDFADLEAFKPPRNGHDQYLSRQRRLFTSPAEQARQNDAIIGRMHGWMDELLGMQEGIAALHMELEGVEVDEDGGFDKETPAGDKDDGVKETGGQGQEEAKEKREDKIMDEMIHKLHQLFGKLQEFHATPHPTIAFPSRASASASVANTAPGTPRISLEEDERKQTGMSWMDKGKGHEDSIPSPLPTHRSPEKKPAAAAAAVEPVRGTSPKVPMDPDHPRQFLRPKQHHDYANDQPPTPDQPSRIPHQISPDPKPSRPRPIVTKPTTHHPDHVDLRRRVLQSQDRKRVESFESLAGEEGGGRPGATRTWSTVLGD